MPRPRYDAIFEYRKVRTVGTAINIVRTVMAAYPLSRPDFEARHIYMALLVFTMLFNGGIIPNYLPVRELGILNTRWGDAAAAGPCWRRCVSTAVG